MVSRVEPVRFYSTSIYKDFLELLEKNHWVPFLEKFDGYNEKVCVEFASFFDGERALLGNVTIILSEDIMA